jgi:hypothetical protein
VRIVVIVKPVPDPAPDGERLEPIAAFADLLVVGGLFRRAHIRYATDP